MTVSTELAIPPKSTSSRNLDFSVSRGTNSNLDFGLILICIEEFEILDLGGIGGVAFLVESVAFLRCGLFLSLSHAFWPSLALAYAHTGVAVFASDCINTHTQAHTHTHRPTLTHTRARTHTHTHTLGNICNAQHDERLRNDQKYTPRTLTHTHTHTHAHTHKHNPYHPPTHTHAHTRTQARQRLQQTM